MESEVLRGKPSMEEGNNNSGRASSMLHKMLPSTKLAKSILLVTVLQAIVIIILECVIMAVHVKSMNDAIHSLIGDAEAIHMGRHRIEQSSRPILVYHGIFIFAVLFDVTAWWDALVHQNLFQSGVLILFNMMCIAYSVIQSYQHGNLENGGHDMMEMMGYNDMDMNMSSSDLGITINTRNLEIVMIAITSAVTAFLIAVAYSLYRQISWQFYEQLGADKQLRRMNFEYLALNTLLKMDTFFFLSYTVQLVSLVLRTRSTGTIIRAALCIPVSIIIIALGFVGARRENRRVMLMFIGGLLLGMGYMLFELIYMSNHQDDVDNPYEKSSDFLYFFSVVTIVLVLLSFYYAFRCYRNFGQGLHLARAFASPDANATREDSNDGDGWLVEADEYAPSKPADIDRSQQRSEKTTSR
ncbi:hypothetical protein IWQ61_000222 [Dispira simplex]|nr:hypothetical protein IWQ61_000222 [Dispira simplex]